MDIHLTSRSKSADLLRDSANLFARSLKIDGRNADVFIRMERGLRRTGAMGTALKVMPGLYVIAVDAACNLDDKLTTIAHEMVHIKQELLGQVRSVGPGNMHRVWRGKLYRKWCEFTAPWEREAYSRERLLVNEAIKELL